MHKILIGVVVAGALVIAGIGFAGSYAAVRELAIKKGFGNFSYVFPIGIDAGICVLLALDLLLTWIRIPFPLLRQTAWVLTVATIAFNGAAAWPDPLGVGMHAVIPVLFVVSVEAARHATGRIADITADKHMEGVRLTRWLLSPVPTFLLWRRMKLWELRSYEQVIKLEQERLVYQARLNSRFGRAWRRKAPVESLMPLRLARYGIPLSETAPAGLAAAGITDPVTSSSGLGKQPPPSRVPASDSVAGIGGETDHLAEFRAVTDEPPAKATTKSRQERHPGPRVAANGVFSDAYRTWLAQFQIQPTPRQFAAFLQEQYAITTAAGDPLSDEQLHPILPGLQERYTPRTEATTLQGRAVETVESGADDVEWAEFFYQAWQNFAQEHGYYPDADLLAGYVFQRDGITTAAGEPLEGTDIETFVADFWQREPGGAALEPIDAAVTDGPSIPSQTGAQNGPETVAVPAAPDTRRPEAQVLINSFTTGATETAEDSGQGTKQGERSGLTTVDRYYLAWAGYQAQYGQEPKDRQLSTHLAETHGVLGRGGQGVSPSTLRRYLPGFRIYAVWSALREHTEVPTAQAVARECATRGISLRREPVTADMIEADLPDFERRWQAFTQDERKISSAD